jgi:hypothetical protein
MGKLDNTTATELAIQEFLNNGGVIQKIPTGKSGRVEGESFSSWSKKKPSTSPLANPPDEDD